MSLVHRAILLPVVCLCCGLGPARAGAAETQLLKAAEQELADGLYQRAEADLAEFIQKNPGSPRLLEAILYQAEARTKLGNYDGALKLLSAYENQSSSPA
jgi:TolA-binding protein